MDFEQTAESKLRINNTNVKFCLCFAFQTSSIYAVQTGQRFNTLLFCSPNYGARGIYVNSAFLTYNTKHMNSVNMLLTTIAWLWGWTVVNICPIYFVFS